MSVLTYQLLFGVPAAERDKDLLKCFVFSSTYSKFENGQKTIIIGPRGAGKSALFRKLSDELEKKKQITIRLAPDEYSYELLSQTMVKEVQGAWAKQGAYAAAWKHLITVTVMKVLTENGSRLKKGPELRIYNYLRDNYRIPDVNPIGFLISYLKRMEGIKIGKLEATVKARELQRLYSLEELEPLYPDIEKCCRNKQVTIFVDELDKGWDASEDAIAFVSGLFQAAVSINGRMSHVRVLMSLRKELYDSIPALYDDAQKVRDIIATLEWDEEKLLELIGRRIANHLDIADKSMTHQERWNRVFTEVLGDRDKPSFNYIVDRTLWRPREIIQFCNDIAETASKKEGSVIPFDYRQITNAERTYSEGRLNDICSEYRFQYPGLKSVLETFRGKKRQLAKNELEEHIIEVICKARPISDEAARWFCDLESEHVIDILWNIGFLKAETVGGVWPNGRSGSSYLGSYQVGSLNLTGIANFMIHPMFMAHLALQYE